MFSYYCFKNTASAAPEKEQHCILLVICILPYAHPIVNKGITLKHL